MGCGHSDVVGGVVVVFVVLVVDNVVVVVVDVLVVVAVTLIFWHDSDAFWAASGHSQCFMCCHLEMYGSMVFLVANYLPMMLSSRCM